MNSVELRGVKNEDRVYFKKWWYDKDLIDLTSRAYEPISEERFNKYFNLILQADSNYHFMILFNGEVVGNASLVKESGDFYEVQIMIGKKDLWGLGIGSQVLDSLLILAKKKKIKKLKLAVRPENKRAINLYKKQGFIEYRKNKEYLFMKLFLKD